MFGAKNLLLWDDDILFYISQKDLQNANLNKYALIYIAMVLGGDFHDGIKHAGDVAALEFLAYFGPIYD